MISYCEHILLIKWTHDYPIPQLSRNIYYFHYSTYTYTFFWNKERLMLHQTVFNLFAIYVIYKCVKNFAHLLFALCWNFILLLCHECFIIRVWSKKKVPSKWSCCNGKATRYNPRSFLKRELWKILHIWFWCVSILHNLATIWFL